MKKSDKKIIAIATGIAAVSALGIISLPARRKKFAMKLKKSLHVKPSRKTLEMVKEKLEKHKTRLEMHLQRINTRLAETETKS